MGPIENKAFGFNFDMNDLEYKHLKYIEIY